MNRPSWDEYFSQICKLIATRATCPRKSVGAAIVKDNHILAVGYNGSLPGLPHCQDVGCDMENDHCVSVVHAEANAICDSAARGTALKGSTLYCTLYPCWSCFKLVVSAGIVEIVFCDEYRMEQKNRVSEAANLIPGFVIRRIDTPPVIEEKKGCGRIKIVGEVARKIKDTGKAADRIDPSEVAKALGAELIDVYPQLPRKLPRKKRK